MEPRRFTVCLFMEKVFRHKNFYSCQGKMNPTNILKIDIIFSSHQHFVAAKRYKLKLSDRRHKTKNPSQYNEMEEYIICNEELYFDGWMLQ